MKNYILTHLGDDALLRELGAIVARDRAMTAVLLAHIAEVDSRKLYVGAGYSSMHAYCVGELHLSDDAAYRRITAGRAARRFPVLFEAVADGRLHLAAVSVLAPHLTAENLAELIDDATHRRKSEIEEVLARRYPPQDAPVRTWLIRALGQAMPEAPRKTVPELALEQASPELSPDELVPGRVEGELVQTQKPPDRFLLRLTIERGTLERLRYLQTLLGHAIPSGDLDKVLDRALQLAIPQVEKQKFGGVRLSKTRTSTPDPARRPIDSRSAGRRRENRHIPAHVRRAVWERDQGRCTFVSASGKRCGEDRFLEFDHINPVARGGRSTVDGLRLRCRAHNQLEAERVFGAEFMARKRREAKLARAGSSLSGLGQTVSE